MEPGGKGPMNLNLIQDATGTKNFWVCHRSCVLEKSIWQGTNFNPISYFPGFLFQLFHCVSLQRPRCWTWKTFKSEEKGDKRHLFPLPGKILSICFIFPTRSMFLETSDQGSLTGPWLVHACPWHTVCSGYLRTSRLSLDFSYRGKG